MDKEKIIKIGEMKFWLDDYRETEYNESVELTYSLYGEEDDEALSIEKYYNYCIYFAKAMGFGETTIVKWFGNY